MPICGRWRRASQEVLVRDVNEARQMPGLLDLWLDNPGFPQGGRDSGPSCGALVAAREWLEPWDACLSARLWISALF